MTGEAARAADRAGTAPAADRGTPPTFAQRVARLFIALFALGGIYVAGTVYLFTIGYLLELCAPGGGCAVVQGSRWSRFLGVPVAAWGVVGYALIFLTAVAGVVGPLSRRAWTGTVLFLLATAALLFTGYLSALEAFVIGAWCRWCVLSAIIVSVIFLLSALDRLEARARRSAAAEETLSRPTRDRIG